MCNHTNRFRGKRKSETISHKLRRLHATRHYINTPTQQVVYESTSYDCSNRLTYNRNYT